MSGSHPAILDPLRFPLRGSALIEASAGTGKTYTIAALYLRLVLRHGGDAAFPRPEPLTPPEILVVTFTEAATQELRDRIRARLAEAADRFLDDPRTVAACPPGTDVLHDLRASYEPAEWPACARRLRLAAEWMDEAAVSTIHGWCNRMLREHAFDSGSLFSQTLEADQADLLDEALRDYWRTFFYPLPADEVTVVSQWWETPQQLGEPVRKLMDLGDALPAGEAPGVALRAARKQSARLLQGIKAPWLQWSDELLPLLDAAVKSKAAEGRKLGHRAKWLQCMKEWAQGDATDFPLTKTAEQRLTPAGLAEAWKVGAPPDHDALRDMETLRARVEGLPQGRDEVLCHATHWVAVRLAAEQERRAQMGFDDLLTQLSAALHGPNGERLAGLIRAQFPVALIDEFQDTDPLQYGIFQAIYGGREDDTALVLIGDPKQAIYAFRGADIHTYLAARRATEGRHATLGTNFRSTAAMVGAVNHVFGQAERRVQGEGAFLFRRPDANPLPFIEVGARGRDETWWVEGAEAPALSCWWLDPGAEVGKDDYTKAMSDASAAAIVRLLHLGQQGLAGFRNGEGVLRPPTPGDVAVLVNNGREARVLRDALHAAGVRSVYLSDKETVFQSAAAGELQRLLQACAEPDDDRLLRAALGTGLLGLDWAALDRLNSDELHWEQRVLQFRGYRQQWRRQGVLPMLRRLLQDFQVPRHLLAAGDERQLTDLLHLAELLQQASALLEGEHALVRHLAEQRAEQPAGGDVRQLRLESDADLLKVVTVHKSKGLEYPLVFVPFACACRPAKEDDLPLKWHDAQGRLQVALAAGAGVLASVDRERLGEDLRKLYVALTRARFACWIGVAPLKNLERSAVGYLLAGGDPVRAGSVEGALRQALGDCDGIAVLPAPQPQGERYAAAGGAPALGREPLLAQAARPPWWIASYSALKVATDGAVSALRVPETATESTYIEERAEEIAELPPAPPSAGGTLHDFPRGPGPGSFLHGLLEWAGREGFAAVCAAPQDLVGVIARRCAPRGWSAWAQPLADWLARWLAQPLDLRQLAPEAVPVAPADLDTLQVEMEFWFSATQVDAQKLDTLVTAHTLGGASRPVLEPRQLNGMLKGFIDLVFEHEGRYYVADYKSNRLGAGDADYTPQALRAEVLRHRYELQYTLYLFALHRLLRARLPDYDYDRHVGGAVYVFLRGLAAPSQGLHMERPPRALMDALDRLFTGAEVPA